MKEGYQSYLKETDLWFAPYLGRRINSKYEEYFDHNGYYPSDDYNRYPEYDEKGIIINLKPHITDGVIESVSYYKKVDHGIYYRGSDDKPITKKDIKIFTDVLDCCTDSVAAIVLDEILQKPLADGWGLKTTSSKTIVIQKGSEKISIPRDYVEQVIDIARSYPDILDNEEFWQVNEKALKTKYMKGLFILLSSYNRDNYPEIITGETAREQYERQEQIRKAREGLKGAVKKGDKSQIEASISILPTIPSDAIDAAIKKRDDETIIKFSSKANYSDLKEIGLYAIKNENYELLDSLIEVKGVFNEWVGLAYKNGKLDCLSYLLEKGGNLTINNNQLLYPIDDLLFLVRFREVVWPLKYLQEMYALEDKGYIKTVIKNIHTGGYRLIDGNNRQLVAGYNTYELCKTLNWIIDINDLDLLGEAVRSGVRLLGKSPGDENQLFLRVFVAGGEVWNIAQKLFSDVPEACAKSYWNCIVDNNYDLLVKLYDYCKIGASRDLVRRAINPVPKDVRITKYIIDIYDENIETDSRVKIPLWQEILRCKNDEVFNHFFIVRGKFLNDSDKEEVCQYMIAYYPNINRARFLAEQCGFPERFAKVVTLAEIIKPREAAEEVEKEISSYAGKHILLVSSEYSVTFIDETTWEVEGSVPHPDGTQNIEFCMRVDSEHTVNVIYVRKK